MEYIQSGAAIATLFQWRTPENFDEHDHESNQITEKKNSKKLESNREPCMCSVLWYKKHKLPQSTFVLLKRCRKPKRFAMSLSEPIFSIGYNAYNRELIEYNQHVISHIKFNIAASSTVERVVWLKTSNQKNDTSVCLMPVVIRKNQTCGVAFIDCMFMPGTQVDDLRNMDTKFINASRMFFKEHGTKLSPVVDVSMTVTEIRDGGCGYFQNAPPNDTFRHICCLCVRNVTLEESFKYLQPTSSDDRFFNYCIPKWLTPRETADITASVHREYRYGLDNWSGTSCIWQGS